MTKFNVGDFITFPSPRSENEDHQILAVVVSEPINNDKETVALILPCASDEQSRNPYEIYLDHPVYGPVDIIK